MSTLTTGVGIDHPFLRFRTDDGELVESWSAGEAALVLVRQPGAVDGPTGLLGVGEPAELAALVHDADLGQQPAEATLTRGTSAHLSDLFDWWNLQPHPGHHSWYRMATTSAPTPPPGTPDPAVAVELDLATHVDEINALLAVTSPGTNHGPDDPRAGRSRWYGWRSDGGELVAVASGIPTLHGSVHLGAIATRPDHRGRGIASAISARATQDGLDSHGIVTLSVLTGNDGARRIYERLGFAVVQQAECWARVTP